MENLLQNLKASHPSLTFEVGETFCWIASESLITYKTTGSDSDSWSLLHELGHARLRHSDYTSDADLLRKELDAWQEALRISTDQAIVIDPDHIESCLDSYRDWLNKRSTCPMCNLQGVQKPSRAYACINCKHTWRVSRELLCRPYRRSK